MPTEKRYNIFISHRLEDSNIASAVSGTLNQFGNKKLTPFVCAYTPGGRDWRDWIEKKIIDSDIMLFLYTVKNSDWSWCFYEIGLFKRLSIPDPPPIICIRNPPISDLPSPIEKYQAYDASESGIKKFLDDLIFNGKLTNGDRINEKIHADDNYDIAIQDLIKAFKPSTIEKKYYARRVLIDLGEKEDDEISIASDSYTMEEILDSPDLSTNWQKLYDNFKAIGQSDWLDQIKESIENIKEEKSPVYVMKQFRTKKNRKIIPVLTRVEKMPSEDNQTTIPLRIYVIFLPCEEIEEKCSLIDISQATDPKYLLELWQTILPTSVIRIKWKRKSSSIRYATEDLEGPPVVYAINPYFADLFNFNYQELPDPDGDNPLTSEILLERIEKFIVDSETYIPKIKKDQTEISNQIIFEGSNANATVPLKFNDKHPSYPNSSHLPCLVSKFTIGDINGPHETFLAIIYVRGNWSV
ncbi:MAG: TIR domain-containing protein [Desulfobacterales bacterium]|jgi:hypothetical protein